MASRDIKRRNIRCLIIAVCRERVMVLQGVQCALFGEKERTENSSRVKQEKGRVIIVCIYHNKL